MIPETSMISSPILASNLGIIIKDQIPGIPSLKVTYPLNIGQTPQKEMNHLLNIHFQVSSVQGPLVGCLIQWIILSNYMGIIRSQCKDANKPISIYVRSGLNSHYFNYTPSSRGL